MGTRPVLGNHAGRLGHGFMEHPCVEIGRIVPTDEKRLHMSLGNRIHRMRRFSPKLSASEDWQRSTQSLNVSAGVVWRFSEENKGAVGNLSAAIRQRSLTHLLKSLKDMPALVSGLMSIVFRGVVYKSGANPCVAVVAEQAPTESSYITLSDQTDRFGVPVAELHWEISRQTWDSIVGFSLMLASELRSADLGKLELKESISLDNSVWGEHLSDVNHHMGGTVMSDDPSTGVVDPNLQVWGISNLYVCSASVFPTGSHSNPTLTLLALAARLVDHLTEQERR